jgi:hypothetical protein
MEIMKEKKLIHIEFLRMYKEHILYKSLVAWGCNVYLPLWLVVFSLSKQAESAVQHLQPSAILLYHQLLIEGLGFGLRINQSWLSINRKRGL